MVPDPALSFSGCQQNFYRWKDPDKNKNGSGSRTQLLSVTFCNYIILASSIIKDGNLVISGGTKVFHLPPGIAPPGAPPGASVGTVSPSGGVQAAPDHGVGRLLFPPTGNNQDGSAGAGVGGRRVVEVLKGTLSGVTSLMYFSLLVCGVWYTVPYLFEEVRYRYPGAGTSVVNPWHFGTVVLIRIRGSVSLTNGTGSGSCYFRPHPSRRQLKTIFC